MVVNRRSSGRPPSTERKETARIRKRKPSAQLSATGHLLKAKKAKKPCGKCGKMSHTTARCPAGREEAVRAMSNIIMSVPPVAADSDQAMHVQLNNLSECMDM